MSARRDLIEVDENGLVVATQGLVIPLPWILRESKAYEGTVKRSTKAH